MITLTKKCIGNDIFNDFAHLQYNHIVLLLYIIILNNIFIYFFTGCNHHDATPNTCLWYPHVLVLCILQLRHFHGPSVDDGSGHFDRRRPLLFQWHNLNGRTTKQRRSRSPMYHQCGKLVKMDAKFPRGLHSIWRFPVWIS